MKTQWLALLLALVVSFSGCLGSFGDDDPDAGQEDQEDDPKENRDENEQDPDKDEDGSEEEEEESNEAPEASLTANLTQGVAPLNVTFTLDGSDPDDDELTWTLDLGDASDPVEGEALPFEFDHTFQDAGNYTVVLTVSDGNETDTAEVDVTIEEPADPRLDTSLEWGPPGNAGCGGPYDVWEFETPLAGALFGELELPDGTAGADFSIEVNGATLEVGFLAFDFYDSEGSLLNVEQDTFAFDDTLTVEGTVPEGAAWVLFVDCLTEGGGEASVLIW